MLDELRLLLAVQLLSWVISVVPKNRTESNIIVLGISDILEQIQGEMEAARAFKAISKL